MPNLTYAAARDRATFAELPAAEHTLLWSVRLWVIGHCRRQPVSARIAAALEDSGLEAVLPHLDAFMGALSRGATRPIELLCLCRTDVSDDERLLLDAFAMCQADNAADAQSLLGTFLTAHAAAYAVTHAEIVAQEFLAGGAVLRHTLDATTTQPVRVLH